MRTMDKNFSQDFLIKKLMDAEIMLRFCHKQFGNVVTVFNTPAGAQYRSVTDMADELKTICLDYYTWKQKQKKAVKNNG